MWEKITEHFTKNVASWVKNLAGVALISVGTLYFGVEPLLKLQPIISSNTTAQQEVITKFQDFRKEQNNKLDSISKNLSMMYIAHGDKLDVLTYQYGTMSDIVNMLNENTTSKFNILLDSETDKDIIHKLELLDVKMKYFIENSNRTNAILMEKMGVDSFGINTRPVKKLKAN